MQASGSGELYGGQADLTRTPEGATIQPDQRQLVTRSETSASPIENVLVDEAPPTISTGVSRQRIHWLPIHDKDVIRCYFETRIEAMPPSEKAMFLRSRFVASR